MNNEVLDKIITILGDLVNEHFNTIVCDGFIKDLAVFLKDSEFTVSVDQLQEFLKSEELFDLDDDDVLEFIDDLNDKLTFQDLEV